MKRKRATCKHGRGRPREIEQTRLASYACTSASCKPNEPVSCLQIQFTRLPRFPFGRSRSHARFVAGRFHEHVIFVRRRVISCTSDSVMTSYPASRAACARSSSTCLASRPSAVMRSAPAPSPCPVSAAAASAANGSARASARARTRAPSVRELVEQPPRARVRDGHAQTSVRLFCRSIRPFVVQLRFALAERVAPSPARIRVSRRSTATRRRTRRARRTGASRDPSRCRTRAERCPRRTARETSRSSARESLCYATPRVVRGERANRRFAVSSPRRRIAPPGNAASGARSAPLPALKSHNRPSADSLAGYAGIPDRLRSVLVGLFDVPSRRVSRSSWSNWPRTASTCHRFRRARGQLARFGFSSGTVAGAPPTGSPRAFPPRPPPHGRRASTRRVAGRGHGGPVHRRGFAPAPRRGLPRTGANAPGTSAGTVNRAKMAPPPRVSVRSSGDAGALVRPVRDERGHPRRPRMRLAGLPARSASFAPPAPRPGPHRAAAVKPRRVKAKTRSRELRRSRSNKTVPTRRPNEKTLPNAPSPFSFSSLPPRPFISDARPRLPHASPHHRALSVAERRAQRAEARDVRRRGRRVASVAEPRRRHPNAGRRRNAASRAYRPRVSESSEERSPPTASNGRFPPPKPPRAASRRPRERGPRARGRVRRGTPSPSSDPSDPSDPNAAVDLPRIIAFEAAASVAASAAFESRARATRATARATSGSSRNVRVVERARSPPARALSTAKTAATPTRTRARGPPRRRSARSAPCRRHRSRRRKDTGAGSDAADAIPRERVPAATSARRGARCATPRREGARPACRERERARARRLTVRLSTRSARDDGALLERAFASRPPRRRAARDAAARPTRAAARRAETVAVSSSSSSSSSAQSGAPASRAPGGGGPARTRSGACASARGAEAAASAALMIAPARRRWTRSTRSERSAGVNVFSIFSIFSISFVSARAAFALGATGVHATRSAPRFTHGSGSLRASWFCRTECGPAPRARVRPGRPRRRARGCWPATRRAGYARGARPTCTSSPRPRARAG